MKYLKHIILVLLIFFIGSSAIELFSRDQKPTRQSAMAAFSGGHYEKAYFEFTELLKTYSKDPLYKYYSAVCLIKLEQNPSEALKLMQDAIASNTAARPLPSDAVFFLGRARHLSGIYHEAVEAYNRYSDQIGRKAAKEAGIPDLIQQCIQKEGAVADAAALIPESSGKEEAEAEEESVDIAPDTDADVDDNIVSDDALLVKEELPGEYSVIVDEALDFQFLADSVSALGANLKKQLVSLPADKRPAARAKIAEYEILAASHQKSADEKYIEAHTAMNPDNQQTEDVAGMEIQVSGADESAADQPDTLAKELLPVTDTVDIFYYFQVFDKPVTDPGVKIVIDPEVPQGLVYRIQVAVFRNPVAPVFFKGITPVYGFKNEGSELKTYYAGMFRNMSDARNALTEIRGKGFKDSFIVSFMGRKTISPDRAAVLEKEWGSKPFERVVNEKQVVVPADSVIPTLTYRVEVMRVAKPVKADVIESMNTLSGGRGLDIITMEDKTIAYLIGNFITFESAAEYADLIVRNGYRDARVVAWLGTREIPLETAKQLFENLK